MKRPKTVKKYCPKLKKHTEHTVKQVKNRGRSAAHPMSRGSTSRIKARGDRRGHGNLGRYSKPTSPKMSGKKKSKRVAFIFKCTESGYSHQSNTGIRAKKVEMI